MSTFKNVYNTMIEQYFQERYTRLLAWLGVFALIFFTDSIGSFCAGAYNMGSRVCIGSGYSV